VRTVDYTDTSTTWVPMPVTENVYFDQAFYLRRAKAPSQSTTLSSALLAADDASSPSGHRRELEDLRDQAQHAVQ